MAGTETPGLQLAPRAKPFNDLLRQELLSYKQEMGITNRQLSKELGTNETAVVKYLNGKPEGDVAKLEAAADSLMRSALKRVQARSTLTSTNVTDDMESAFETIRKTNDVGLVAGASGIGKTCGCALYLMKNPICILISASTLMHSKEAVIGMIWNEVKPRDWNTSHGTHLQVIGRRLGGANRMIIVDDAHRLSRSGLRAVFAIHDLTESPVALAVFDNEVENLVAADGQLYSRIGLRMPLKLKSTEELARHLIEQFAPDSGEELVDLSLQVIREQGHGRALRKQLLLARDIRENLEGTRRQVDWPTAFRAAHTRLIRPYDLTE